MALPVRMCKSEKTSEMCGSQRPWSCSLGTTEDLGPFVKSWVLCFLSWVETLRVAKPVLWHQTCFQLCSRGCQLWLHSRGIWCDPKAQTRYQRAGARAEEAHLLLWLLSRWFTGKVGVEACVFQALPALFWPYLTNWRRRGEIKPNQRGWPGDLCKTSEDFLPFGRQMYSVRPNKWLFMLTSQVEMEAMQNQGTGWEQCKNPQRTQKSYLWKPSWFTTSVSQPLVWVVSCFFLGN